MSLFDLIFSSTLSSRSLINLTQGDNPLSLSPPYNPLSVLVDDLEPTLYYTQVSSPPSPHLFHRDGYLRTESLLFSHLSHLLQHPTIKYQVSRLTSHNRLYVYNLELNEPEKT